MAAAGVDIQDLVDFTLATGNVQVHGPKGFINNAARNCYMFSDLINESPHKKMLQGGERIQFETFFRGNGTFEAYATGQPSTVTNPQRLVVGTADWRKFRAQMAFYDDEILLNDKIRYGTEDIVYEQFVRLRDSKKAILDTEIWASLDDQCLAVPNFLTMESQGGVAVRSIPVFINEYTNGLFNDQSGTTTSYSHASNGTIHGIGNAGTATTGGRWKCQQQTYASTSATPAAGTFNIVDGCEALWKKCEFKAPTTFAEYFTNTEMRNQWIRFSDAGLTFFQQLMRLGQNHYVIGPQDPSYPDPQIHGIPVKRAPQLDSAALYSTGSALTTEGNSSATNRGPRAYLGNSNYLYPVWNPDRFWYLGSPRDIPSIPDGKVVYWFSWHNIICTSLRNQGILYPSGQVYAAY